MVGRVVLEPGQNLPLLFARQLRRPTRGGARVEAGRTAAAEGGNPAPHGADGRAEEVGDFLSGAALLVLRDCQAATKLQFHR